MAASTYNEALRRLLAHEGGYAHHPSDPGGPTKFGITIHDYRKYVRADASAEDVRAMSADVATAIYRDRYWHALRCDELPAGLDYAVFDYGVNSGVSRAAKVLQRLLGLPDTGRMTDAAIAAAKARDAADLISRLCEERLAFLKSLRTWPVFGKGWGRRVAEVRRAALAMAKGAGDAAVPSPAPGRGQLRTGRTARVATGAGAAVAGGAAAAHSAGLAWSAVAVWLALAAALALGGLLVWRVWQRWRQDAPADASVLAQLRGRIKGWRTVAFGALVAGAGLIADLLDALQAIDLAPLLPPSHAVKIIAVIGIVTVLLRLVTTGRVGRREG